MNQTVPNRQCDDGRAGQIIPADGFEYLNMYVHKTEDGCRIVVSIPPSVQMSEVGDSTSWMIRER